MKKNSIIIVSLCVFALLGWYFYNTNKYAPKVYVEKTPQGEKTVNTVTGTSSPVVQKISMETIASHGTAESCYSVILDDVYDLTAWVNMHPGGKGPILAVCGKNGTDIFVKKHAAGIKYMTILAKYRIGKLQ